MTTRCVAALMFVSWYLLVPPPPNDDYEQLVPKAPLSSWEQIDSYPTLRECRNDIKVATNDASAETMVDFGLLRCVASDDPRLKGN